jgi:hypothetical protein
VNQDHPLTNVAKAAAPAEINAEIAVFRFRPDDGIDNKTRVMLRIAEREFSEDILDTQMIETPPGGLFELERGIVKKLLADALAAK